MKFRLLVTLFLLSGFLAVIQPQFAQAAGNIECPELEIGATKIFTISCMFYDTSNLVAWFLDGNENAAGIFHKSGSNWDVSYYISTEHSISVEFIANQNNNGILLNTTAWQYYFQQSSTKESRNGWYAFKQAELDKLKLDSKFCPVFSYHDKEVKQVGCFFLQFGITMNFASVDDVFYMFMERDGRVDEFWSKETFTSWRDEKGIFGFKDTNGLNTLIPQEDTKNFKLNLSQPAT